MAAFPGAIATFAGFVASHTLSVDNHAAQHNLEQAEIVATQTKVGYGSSTPTSGLVLRGNGVGTSAWAQVALTTDVSGVLPIANGGNGTTSTTGTGSAVFSVAPALTGGGSWSGSPTISTPTIADFTNSNHSHQNVSGGGQLNGGSAIQSGTVDSTRINFGGSGAGVWWEEIGRTTLGVAGDTISVTSLPARKYLQIHYTAINTGSIVTVIRFNNDSANNYAFQYMLNNTGGNTTASSNIGNLSSSSKSVYGVMQVINIATLQKLFTSHTAYSTATAASAPDYISMHGLWNNVAAQITRVDLVNTDTGDFAAGSELVILGHN